MPCLKESNQKPNLRRPDHIACRGWKTSSNPQQYDPTKGLKKRNMATRRKAPGPSLLLLVLFIFLLGRPESALTIIELKVQKATQTKRVNKDIQTILLNKRTCLKSTEAQGKKQIWFSILNLERVVLHFGLSLIMDEEHRLTHSNTILPKTDPNILFQTIPKVQSMVIRKNSHGRKKT